MRIEYQGEAYEFELSRITIKQAIKIEKYLGCPISDFSERLFPEGKNPDLEALQCLGWLILHGGRGVPIEDTDFELQALIQAVTAAVAPADEPAESAEDPTPAAAAANGAGPADGQLIVR